MNADQVPRPLNVLLVEDNPDDIEITRRAFSRVLPSARLAVARDGQAALDFLLGEGTYEGRPALRPDIVLLDLNMPKANGLEVLRAIRSTKTLETVRVVVLTASAREDDINQSYRLGADTYIKKPGTLEEFLRAIEMVAEYWTGVARLPSA